MKTKKIHKRPKPKRGAKDSDEEEYNGDMNED